MNRLYRLIPALGPPRRLRPELASLLDTSRDGGFRRVSFGESGAGWLAYALHRMDFEFEDRFRHLMKLKPSEYWRRQCKATL